MKITLEIPDETKCMNVCVVYQDGYPAMAMAATMRGTDDLRDGAVFVLPTKRKESADDGESC
jgi:hypothetical protein